MLPFISAMPAIVPAEGGDETTIAPSVATAAAHGWVLSDGASSFTVNMPSGSTAGNLIIAIMSSRKTAAGFAVSMGTASGWTPLIFRTNSASGNTLGVWYRVLTAPTATVSWPVSTSGPSSIGIITARILNHSATDGMFVPIASSNIGTSGNTDPPGMALPAEWGANPHFLAIAAGSNTNTSISGGPSGYAYGAQLGSSASGSQNQVMWGYQQNQNVGFNPGPFTPSSSSWVSGSIAIRGA